MIAFPYLQVLHYIKLPPRSRFPAGRQIPFLEYAVAQSLPIQISSEVDRRGSGSVGYIRQLDSAVDDIPIASFKGADEDVVNKQSPILPQLP